MNVFKMLVLSLLVLPVISRASQNTVPGGKVSTVVKSSFSEKWPEENVKKWKKKDDQFVAIFYQRERKFESSFDEEGNWLQTENQIKWNELPSSVQKTFYASDYRWLNWNSVEKLRTPKYKEVYLIKGDNLNTESDPISHFKLWITPDGKVVKTVPNE